MSYSVKEIFYTLQGEGAQAGRAAVFCRFAGCNLWSGREQDRASAACTFCDTDFVGTDGPGGGKFESAAALAQAVRACWPADGSGSGDRNGTGDGNGTGRSEGDQPVRMRAAAAPGALVRPLVVCTGGEPLLQLDTPLLDSLHAAGFEVAVETNGTQPAPPGLDWICVSPKGRAPLQLTRGDELKLVYPQADAPPAAFEALDFRHFILQPMDGPARAAATQAATRYCLEHPQWRLGLQTHKIIGID